ncbi:MAG: FAD-dependent oxidoreductase [Synergistaceae bacterium]|nr:FAD-dependent oxidoreductase [Synergistaceae bacterium]
MKSKLNFLIALCVFVFLASTCGAEIKNSYDVVIAGGGTGGTAAAIQASRLGVSVLIIEPTSMLGGQATAAGVSTMDDMSRIESGIYKEFIDRVKKYYSDMKKSINTPYWKEHGKAFEPSVGDKILKDMTASADILYHSQIVSVKNENESRFVSVQTPDGVREINFKILIDATEYGDILPLVGARYRSGNSISPNINKNSFIQDITWTAIIRKYPGGVPENLKPKNPLPDYERAKKNYKNYVTANGFDFQGKYPVKMPVNLISHNAYRAVPDSFTPGNYTGAKKYWPKISKTGVNWGNDYPGMYLLMNHYGLNVMFLEDKETRAQMERDALIKTLHFIYYIQHELGANWSVDENEYGELPEAAKDFPNEWKEIARHMPPIPYVRESRRALGAYTLNSKAVHENSLSWRNGHKNHEFSDAIAIGGYNLDLHGGDDDDDIESELGEKQSSIWGNMPQGPFQVPMKILIPESVDNFIAAEKNLSMSRLVSSALRLQPITMMTGQAAGALAAVAIQLNLQPREVHPVHVQKRLAEAGVVLSLCNYSDVPREHKNFAGVQVSNLYGLLRPRAYPSMTGANINSSGSKGQKGRFGADKLITRSELDGMIARAEEVMNAKIKLPPLGATMTRGDAVDMIVNAMDEIY